MDERELRREVRERYAAAAGAISDGQPGLPVVQDCCGSAGIDGQGPFGSGCYDSGDRSELPIRAVSGSLGCGSPTVIAELNEGETVLDLGAGGGIDALLAARRVGPDGFVYGIDMTDEMLELAEGNRADAAITNVEFRKGTIEDIPLPDHSVDVVISNCVINLSVDKQSVFSEIFRVLSPGGRVAVSDVVAEDHLSVADRAERGSYVGCVAGALSRQEYLDELASAGFTDLSVEFTAPVAEAMHAASIRAFKP